MPPKQSNWPPDRKRSQPQQPPEAVNDDALPAAVNHGIPEQLPATANDKDWTVTKADTIDTTKELHQRMGAAVSSFDKLLPPEDKALPVLIPKERALEFKAESAMFQMKAEKRGAGPERTAMLAAEREAMQAHRDFYASNNLLQRAIKRGLARTDPNEMKEIREANAKYAEARAAYARKMYEGKGGAKAVALDVFDDTIRRAADLRTAVRAEALSSKKTGILGKTFGFFGNLYKASYKRFPKATRAAGILFGAGVGTAIGSWVGATAAVGIGVYGAWRLVKGLGLTTLGGWTGNKLGEKYEKGEGSRSAEKLKEKRAMAVLSAKGIRAQEHAYREGTPEAIARKKQLVKMGTAFLTSFGGSFTMAEAFGHLPSVSAATETLSTEAPQGGGTPGPAFNAPAFPAAHEGGVPGHGGGGSGGNSGGSDGGAPEGPDHPQTTSTQSQPEQTPQDALPEKSHQGGAHHHPEAHDPKKHGHHLKRHPKGHHKHPGHAADSPDSVSRADAIMNAEIHGDFAPDAQGNMVPAIPDGHGGTVLAGEHGSADERIATYQAEHPDAWSKPEAPPATPPTADTAPLPKPVESMPLKPVIAPPEKSPAVPPAPEAVPGASAPADPNAPLSKTAVLSMLFHEASIASPQHALEMIKEFILENPDAESIRMLADPEITTRLPLDPVSWTAHVENATHAGHYLMHDGHIAVLAGSHAAEKASDAAASLAKTLNHDVAYPSPEPGPGYELMHPNGISEHVSPTTQNPLEELSAKNIVAELPNQ